MKKENPEVKISTSSNPKVIRAIGENISDAPLYTYSIIDNKGNKVNTSGSQIETYYKDDEVSLRLPDTTGESYSVQLAFNNETIDSNSFNINKGTLVTEPSIGEVKATYSSDENIVSLSIAYITDPFNQTTKQYAQIKRQANTTVYGSQEINSLELDIPVTHTTENASDYYVEVVLEYEEQNVSKNSNVFTISSGEDVDFPETLPVSNTWAYAEEQRDSVRVTINNTFAEIFSQYAVYIDKKLVGLGNVNYTAETNHGSIEDNIDFASHNINSGDDYKIVYKVRYNRSESDYKDVYYKSNTGEVYAVDENGDKTRSNTITEPLNSRNVESIGTPMEKMHGTYTQEASKWGGRNYTPKMTPFHKISHIFYAFIDCCPDYLRHLIGPADVNETITFFQAVSDCPNYNPAKSFEMVAPNILDPGAAFSDWGYGKYENGVSVKFMPDFMEEGAKFPYTRKILSIGGWSRSGFFRDVLYSQKTKDYFTDRLEDLIVTYAFEGVDLDWEFVGYERSGDNVDNASDMGTPRGGSDEGEIMTGLMQLIREKLDEMSTKYGKYFTLSVAQNVGINHLNDSHISDWEQYPDFINFMTYDLHGAFDYFTGHQSYLYPNPMEPEELKNPNIKSVDEVITHLKGILSDYTLNNKMNIGSPFYSRGWCGVPNKEVVHGLPGMFQEVTPDRNEAIKYSAPGSLDGGRAAGNLPIIHIKKLLNGTDIQMLGMKDLRNPNPYVATGDTYTLKASGFKEYFDDVSKAAYIYNSNSGFLYSFENEQSLQAKIDYVKENNLHGLFHWDESVDDYDIDHFCNQDDTIILKNSEIKSARENHKYINHIFDNFKSQK